ncbi:UbiH/UbiF family hydroxylase [Amorphus orientalis]|uniref:2-octaprenyl-6-methoxyphenol hydroxylase n=1 Tax=Amorphus orientalis TaxID=649198 RepID=A0AAE4AT31_9HYPH|nr:UbiH/UbiF family hydroxylase [Amorphus orientalis]MDQ0315928.1 2-octaprenyl-6-methoxyphenol hydroxylase [Amorphus orientalis]
MVSDAEPVDHQIAVVGAGPAGLTAALLLRSQGFDVTLVGPRPAGDPRTTALLTGSVNVLAAAGAWSRAEDHAAPMRTMRIVDATDRLVRSPEAAFQAGEIGLEAFGFNIENDALNRALIETAEAADLPWIEAPVESAETAGGRIVMSAGGKRVSALLAVAADGARSFMREAVGIGTRSWTYPQQALVTIFGHTLSHNDTSTEFHTRSGPFTVVPLQGRRSSLVWVVHPDEAPWLERMTDGELAREIEIRTHRLLGRVTVEATRGLLPLSGMVARKLADERVALVGEAAHRFPPIGAQGLNLGFRDIAGLAEVLVQARDRGADPGSDATLSAYARRRRADVESRTLAVDLLNRSLLSDFVPVSAARGIGLFAATAIGPLRRFVMREGLAPAIGAPRLVRGLPL